MEFTERHGYSVQEPETSNGSPLQRHDGHINQFDFDRENCKCGGANCNCDRRRGPMQTFAPMNFYRPVAYGILNRYRRSAPDSTEAAFLNEDVLRPKKSKRVKSFKKEKYDDADELMKAMQDDDFVLERME